MGHGRTRESDAQPAFAIADAEIDSQTHVIAVSGEVDLYAGPEFREHVRTVIDSGACRLVIDLLDVSFMDSTGLGVLFNALKRLRSRDGELAIVCDDANIHALFEIVGLERIFAIYPSRDAAARALAARSN